MVSIERMKIVYKRFGSPISNNNIRNKDVYDRFDKCKKAVDELIESCQHYDYSDNADFKYKNLSTNLSSGAFGPRDNALLSGAGIKCYNLVYEKINNNPNLVGTVIKSELLDLHKDAWYLVAGWIRDNEPYDQFRIISNTKTNIYDIGTLTCGAVSAAPNQNFASNNYFFQFARFLSDAKNTPNASFNSLINDSKIVLTWDDQLAGGGDVQKFATSQRILSTRFPLKLLWTWANKDSCIPILSLAQINKMRPLLLKSNNFDPIEVDFDNFTTQWPNISTQLFNNITNTTGLPTANDFLKFGKFLASTTLGETSLRTAIDVLKTGNKTLILTGAPGTGKTRMANLLAEELCGKSPKKFLKLTDDEKKNRSDNLPGCVHLVQFHPGYAYEDFIGGIRPKIDGSTLNYEVVSGIFKDFCEVAQRYQNIDPPEKPFVFIIDEINRADLASVFGEVLSRIEIDYRNLDSGISLPNFNQTLFHIPKNVYLIGTMNSLDKSLVTFDFALRRRFPFVKLLPELNSIASVNDMAEHGVENIGDFITRCENMNIDIVNELELTGDYVIGQAYFLRIFDFIKVDKSNSDGTEAIITEIEREQLWEFYLKPLIEEYLGGKIQQQDIMKNIEKIGHKFILD